MKRLIRHRNLYKDRNPGSAIVQAANLVCETFNVPRGTPMQITIDNDDITVDLALEDPDSDYQPVNLKLIKND